MKKVIFTDEIKQFIFDNNNGNSSKELTRLLNEEFETNFTVTQIKNFRARFKLISGVTGRFEKGHVPINKGKKGMFNVGGNKTSFKKGNIPKNFQPIGTEVIGKGGYIYIKVDDKKNVPKKENWKPKHRVIWEKANGPIPKGHFVIFLDQDKTNLKLENLEIISMAENLIMNRQNLYYDNPELTKTGVAIARLLNKVNKKKGEHDGKHQNK